MNVVKGVKKSSRGGAKRGLWYVDASETIHLSLFTLSLLISPALLTLYGGNTVGLPSYDPQY